METVEILDRAEINGDTVVVQYSKTEAALSDLRGKYKGVAYDLTTTKGDKEARAARLELITLRTSLEKKRKEFKAPALEFGKKIDSEAARITIEILELENPIDQQIKADEFRRAAEKAERDRIEAARVQALRDKIAAIWALVDKCHGISAERIAKGIAQVEQIDTSPVVFAEYSNDAERTRAETLKAMRGMHEKAIEREAESARVEAQRVENERVAAENKAKADALTAQQAAIDKAAADLKAAQDAAAKEQEERDRQEREKVAAEQTAFEKQEQEEIERLAKLNSTLIVAAPAAAPVISEPSGPRMILTPRPAVAAKPTKAPTLALGTISERLGFNVTSAFLATLGFEATTVKAAKLFHESEFPAICSALIEHIQDVVEGVTA
jgi:hypothetical protein